MDLFYTQKLDTDFLVLRDEQHRHCVKSLRKNIGDVIYVTDGQGKRARAILTEIKRNESVFEISQIEETKRTGPKVIIGIGPTKNMSRFEWFLEKAVELGIYGIVPFVSQNSERQHLKIDRCKKIMVSAMKQSLRSWLPEIVELQPLAQIEWDQGIRSRFVGYVQNNTEYLGSTYKKNEDVMLLIGPEGGFTKEEILQLQQDDFTTVSLGDFRLRTETAGLTALQIIHTINKM